MARRFVWIGLVALCLCLSLFPAAAQPGEPTLEIWRDDDLLVIAVITDTWLDLFGLTFVTPSVGGQTDSRALFSDFPELASEDFYAPPGRCFAYIRQGTVATLPDSCDLTTQAVVPPRSVFWTEDPFLVLAESTVQGRCRLDTACQLPYQALRLLHDDFTRTDWNRQLDHWGILDGVCSAGQADGMGVLTATVSEAQAANGENYCALPLVDAISRSEGLALAAVGGFGATIQLEPPDDPSAQIDQGIGMSEAGGVWWSFCGLRRVDGFTYAVFEMADSQTNVYELLPLRLPTEPVRFRLQVAGDGSTLDCWMNEQPLGSMALTDTDLTPESVILRTMNSNYPAGTTSTRFDEVYTWPPAS